MGRKMTWEEIRKSFPNEWVAIVDYGQSGAIGISGTVAAHAAEKEAFYQRMKAVRKLHNDIAVRYTGKLVNNPEIPRAG